MLSGQFDATNATELTLGPTTSLFRHGYIPVVIDYHPDIGHSYACLVSEISCSLFAEVGYIVHPYSLCSHKFLISLIPILSLHLSIIDMQNYSNLFAYQHPTFNSDLAPDQQGWRHLGQRWCQETLQVLEMARTECYSCVEPVDLVQMTCLEEQRLRYALLERPLSHSLPSFMLRGIMHIGSRRNEMHLCCYWTEARSILAPYKRRRNSSQGSKLCFAIYEM